MKTVLAILLILGAVIVVLFLQPAQTHAAVQLQMASNPFPLAVGRTTLYFSLSDTQGRPVSDAVIAVAAQMDKPGMVPLRGQSRQTADGLYEVSLVWPMTGNWTLSVHAQAGETLLQEQYKVFVYTVSPRVDAQLNRFRSVRETGELITDTGRELLIFIPLGTEAQMRSGHSEDIIPENILLQVGGQDTLVIQNDDIADHTIGPFFIRSGELIRQTFTQPAVYQGTCSVNDSTLVNIIVEE